uniref:MHC class II beta chain N-terminal domain-containing protein n=1 Tax=Ursus americanus TaxID=9643 RepID=A0A452QMZ0_URSAM
QPQDSYNINSLWIFLTPLCVGIVTSVLQITSMDFVLQFKGECYFTNGTERVRGVTRHIYNREEFVRFDSDVGEHRAVTELGRPIAEYFNQQKDFMEQTRAAVDTVCRHNYQIEDRFILQRRGEPGRSHPIQTEVLNHHNLPGLLQTDFYPRPDQSSWFEEPGRDSSCRILVMLEMTPQRGDVYTCLWEHPSLQTPSRGVRVKRLAPQGTSEFARSKMTEWHRRLVLGIFLGGSLSSVTGARKVSNFCGKWEEGLCLALCSGWGLTSLKLFLLP